ncbi:MAG: hypothetical protein AAF849_02820 [Bacteroidota bacterium]
MERVNFSSCTLASLEEKFHLDPVLQLDVLDDWLDTKITTSHIEQQQLEHFRNLLSKNVLHWNEYELSLNFIGPVFGLVEFTDKKFNFFAQRSLSAFIEEIELFGKIDGMIASGFRAPKLPYFAFHEFKKEADSSGDPAGQNLAAMLVGQALNDHQIPIYGCYVNGRNWHFMALEDRKYCISEAYSSTSKTDVLDIFRILKGLKKMILDRVENS